MFGLSQERLNQKYLEEYVGEYGSVSEEQLDRIMFNAGFNGKKRHSYHNSLRMFSEINFDRTTKCYYSSSHVTANQSREQAMERIQWVIIDFLGRIEHHFRVSTDFSPSLICMMLENRSYELVYAARGQEAYLDNQLKAARMELLYRAESSFFAPLWSRTLRPGLRPPGISSSWRTYPRHISFPQSRLPITVNWMKKTPRLFLSLALL